MGLKQNKPSFYSHKICFFIALEFVLAFSGIGYFIPYDSATIMYIPVIIAAYLYGKGAGALIGAVFGITSIWKASIIGVGYFDSLFSPLSSGNVIGSVYLSLGARILFGFISGMLFSAFNGVKFNEYVKVVFLSIIAHLIHTMLVLIPMEYLFPQAHIDAEYIAGNIFSFIEIIQIFILSLSMWTIVYITKSKRLVEIKKILNDGRQSYYTKRLKIEGIGFAVFLFLIIFSLMLHLHGMTITVANASNTIFSNQARVMFINLQIQFLVGAASLSYIIGAFITLYRMYSIYHISSADKDIMTGLYSKATAVNYGGVVIRNKKDFPDTYFMMLDIDDFKNVNDTYGHLMGDKVIIDIARFLEKHFGLYGLVARFGGDEFAVFITRALKKEDIEKIIKDFQSDTASILLANGKIVTCSIGITHIENEKNFNEVYKKADEMLYYVKTSGRNGYKFYE